MIDTQFIDSIPAAFRQGDGKADAKQEESANVRLVERIYRIIAADDFDALGDVLADDAVLEIIGPPGVPFVGNYPGRDLVIETTRRNFSEVEAQRPEILSVVAQGNTVVVVGREQGRFRATGQEYEVDLMNQFTFRDGKLAHIRELFDSASVLKAAASSQTSQENYPAEENRALVLRWFEEVWNKGRTEAVGEMFADDSVAYGLADDGGEPTYGPAGFMAHYRKVREAFPDITITVVDVVAEGDKVAARCVVRGTHTGDGLGFAATHKPIEITGLLISRIKDGKFVECWNTFDLLGLYRQLGVIS